MTVTYHGSLTLGACVPAAQDAQAEISASVNAVLPDVQARLTGLLALSVQPPPSIAELLASAQAVVAALQQLLVAPLPDVAATAAAIADLQATIGQLNASLSFAATLGSLLGQPGIHYYVYAGRAGQVGPELQAELSGGLPGGSASDQIAGAILLASDGGAINALQAVLRS